MTTINLQNRVKITQRRKYTGGGGSFTYEFIPSSYNATNDGDFVETILTTTNPADPSSYLTNSDGSIVNFTTFQIDATNWAIDCNIDAGGPSFPADVTLKTPDNTAFTINLAPLAGLLFATVTGGIGIPINCPPNGSINVPVAPGAPILIQGTLSSSYDSTPTVTGANFDDPMTRIGKTCTTTGNSDTNSGSVTAIVISDGVGHTFSINLVSSISFNANSSYSIPTGVTQIRVIAVGGGGAGGGGFGNKSGGGGSGAQVLDVTVACTPGEVVSIVIGAGGAGVGANTDGNSGDDSTVTVSSGVITALKGIGGGKYGSFGLNGFNGSGSGGFNNTIATGSSGFNGGAGDLDAGGGGAGSGQSGFNGDHTNFIGGNGGNGRVITGVGTFGGGGAGSDFYPGVGGSGGGGTGQGLISGAPHDGAVNTGGGGGASLNNSGFNSGAGGTGFVQIIPIP